MMVEPNASNVDDILLQLGTPGRFQVFQLIFLALQYLPLSINDVMPIFYSLPPTEFFCPNSTNKLNSSRLAGNASFLEIRKHNQGAACNCDGKVEYIYEGKQWSIIADMDLICDRAHLVHIASIIYFIGQMIATPLFGWMADKFGRRPILLMSNSCYAGICIGLIFSYDYVSFVILRFLTGVFRQGISSSFYVLMVEWLPPKRRGTLAALVEIVFAGGVLLITLIAYLLQNWHHIQTGLSVLTVFSVPLIWFAPESLTWSCMNGRVKEAEDNCRKIAKFNSIDLSDATIQELHSIAEKVPMHERDREHFSFLDCLRTPQVRKTTCLCCFVWLACYFGYLGLLYLSSKIAADVYLNLAINGALELIPIVLAMAIASRFGNKKPLIVYYFIGGVVSIIAGVIPTTSAPLRIGQNVLAFIGRMAFVGVACVMFVYTTELFPAVIRNNGFSICSIALRVGSITTPMLIDIATVTYSGTSFLIVGCVALLASTAAFFLRETKGLPMPRTIADAEALGVAYSMRKTGRKIVPAANIGMESFTTQKSTTKNE